MNQARVWGSESVYSQALPVTPPSQPPPPPPPTHGRVWRHPLISLHLVAHLSHLSPGCVLPVLPCSWFTVNSRPAASPEVRKFTSGLIWAVCVGWEMGSVVCCWPSGSRLCWNQWTNLPLSLGLWRTWKETGFLPLHEPTDNLCRKWLAKNMQL